MANDATHCIIAALCISAALGSIEAITINAGILYALLLSAADFPMAFITSRLYTEIVKIHKKRLYAENIARCLRSALLYTPKGVPLAKALESSADLSADAGSFIRKLSRMLLLGKALRARNILEAMNVKASDAEVHGIEIGTLLMYALDAFGMENQRRMAAMRGSLQRDATISMFVSAVLPAFVVFMLIGNAALSGDALLLPFSIVMLGVLPLLYAFGSSSMNRRFLE